MLVLYDDILIYLFTLLFYAEHIDSLRACSLVHSTWHTLCRSFVLRRSLFFAPIGYVLMSLKNDPSIGSHVRSLTLVGSLGRGPILASPYDHHPTRALNASNVFTAVSYMPFLEKLVICGFRWVDEWGYITPPLMPKLRELVVVDILSVSYGGNVMELLHLSSTWTSVTMRRVYWHSMQRDERMEVSSQSLVFTFPCKGSFATSFVSHLPVVSDLRHLRLDRVKAEHTKYVRSLFGARPIFRTLDTLHIDIDDDIRGPTAAWGEMGIASCSSLRVFVLCMTLDPLLAFPFGPPSTPSRCLRHVLENLPPALETFELRIRSSSSPTARFARHLGEVDWVHTSNELQQLKNLKSIKLVLNPPRDLDDAVPVWTDRFASVVLPGFNRSWTKTVIGSEITISRK